MKALLAVLFMFAPLLASAFQVPPLEGPVMDRAEMLSPEMETRLSDLLRQVRSRGGSQLQILTVPQLDGTPVEQAALQVVETWKLGSAQKDDGILLLIAAQERAIRIEVGQGREGELPDVIAKRIISDVMVPAMRKGAPDSAVFIGTLNILRYSDPEILEALGERVPKTRKKQGGDLGSLGLFLLILVVLFLQAVFGRRRHWGGGFGRGGFGGYGGGFGGGFGGGGGWSGGGGGFSGGGASGNW